MPKNKTKPPKLKLAKNKSTREPDVVDAIDATVKTMLENGHPANQPIIVNVSISVPVEDGNGSTASIGIVRQVRIEDVQALPDEEGTRETVMIDIPLEKHDVIELYKIATGTHPHIKAASSGNVNITPLQLR